MNARCHDLMTPGSPSTHDDPRRQLLHRVLASPVFTKAPRMTALLSFLMETTLQGLEASIDEFTIGVEVFHRRASDFDTTIDPIVRVQIGRLRERLARYDALPGCGAGPRIVIPPGSYVPQVVALESAARPWRRKIQLAPVRMLTPAGRAGSEFVAGLEEELALQLFRRFSAPGGHCVAPDALQDDSLEVSVRVDRGHVRASIRLSDVGTGRLALLQQCDVHGALGIGLQETLAQAICDDLQHHLRAAASSPVPFVPVPEA